MVVGDTGGDDIAEENGVSVDLSRGWVGGGGIQEMTLERRMVCLWTSTDGGRGDTGGDDIGEENGVC